MARITKSSLEELAKEVAALEAAEATILSPEEKERYAGGHYGAYTSLASTKPMPSEDLEMTYFPRKWGKENQTFFRLPSPL